MTDKLKAAAEMALEALEDVQEAYGNTSEWFRDRVDALRQALVERDKLLEIAQEIVSKAEEYEFDDGLGVGISIDLYQRLAAAVDDEPDTGIDRGAWDDVPDATKWVDELRGDEDLEEPPNSTTDVVEPEPFGWLFKQRDSYALYKLLRGDDVEWTEKHNPCWIKVSPLYTAPPQREWVGLTDEDYKALEIETLVSNMGYREVLRWADKRLKEKNHVD